MLSLGQSPIRLYRSSSSSLMMMMVTDVLMSRLADVVNNDLLRAGIFLLFLPWNLLSLHISLLQAYCGLSYHT